LASLLLVRPCLQHTVCAHEHQADFPAQKRLFLNDLSYDWMFAASVLNTTIISAPFFYEAASRNVLTVDHTACAGVHRVCVEPVVMNLHIK
jgi:hypothetical protein